MHCVCVYDNEKSDERKEKNNLITINARHSVLWTVQTYIMSIYNSL